MFSSSAYSATCEGRNAYSTTQASSNTQTSKQAKPPVLSLYEQSLVKKGVPTEMLPTFQFVTRTSSQRQYDSYLSRWEIFNEQYRIDPLGPLIPAVLTFLEDFRVKHSLSYASLNTARYYILPYYLQ